jgi:Flp pilus assembly protein TadD
MGGTSRLRFLLLVSALLMSLAADAFAGDPQWVEIRSPHFSVVTDAGERQGRDVALRFEQMRAVFGALMTRATVNLPVPLQIIAFRNSKELRQFTPLWNGKPTQLAGLFQGGEDRCFIMLDLSVEHPWQVVFHEYAHQLMNGTLARSMDPWFEEGFAEYFSSIEVDGKEARVGKVPEVEYQILAQLGWMKISDLFRVQHNGQTYNENGDHRSVFYAESGMLVHYLYDNALITNAGHYFGLRDNHVAVEEAIQQAFGMSAAQLDKSLHNYEGSGRYQYHVLPAPADLKSSAFSSAPLSGNDVLAVVADVHLHSPDYRDKAAGEFEAVLKLDPNHPAALRGLGYSYLVKRDFAKAGEYFHKAAEHSPSDPRVLYYSALLAQREGSSRTSGEDSDRLNAMQKELETSIRLDPSFADAYSVLAFTYMQQRKQDQALQALLKAVELNPRNDQYRFNLAEMYLYGSNFDAATTILEDLKNSRDPEVVERSTHELERVQDYRRQLREQEQARTPGNQTGTGGHISLGEPELVQSKPAQPARFLKGKLLAVDCSAAPAAVLTIAQGAKTWKMRATNRASTIVIGADQFSCDWTNRKVAVNYRETGDGQGEIISLEIQ